VDTAGKRRVLGVLIGSQESQNSWSELLRQLTDRGLRGVRLMIADDHAGIAAALRTHLPEATYQRCTVHLVRNIIQKVPHRLRGRLVPRFAELFKASSLSRAEKLPAELAT